MLVSTDRKWDYALGMIKIDGLEPSSEFKKLIERKKCYLTWKRNIPAYDLQNLLFKDLQVVLTLRSFVEYLITSFRIFMSGQAEYD